jgi:hypothetical protein
VGIVAGAHPRTQGGGTCDPRRCEGPAQGGDPGRQPGDRARGRDALQPQGRGARRRAMRSPSGAPR